VRVTVPDLFDVETPAPAIVVSFLPYNRDSIVQSLEAKAGPRPHTRELDSLFRAFREPYLTYFRLVATSERLAQSPSGVDSLVALKPKLAVARQALERARAGLGPLIDSLRRDGNAWEVSTYGGYQTITRDLQHNAMVNPVADTTDALGRAVVSLPKGTWWATARAIDARDPNAEWYWNVRITGDSVRLDPRSGRNRPRY
jgi:hypothetical protein